MALFFCSDELGECDQLWLSQQGNLCEKRRILFGHGEAQQVGAKGEVLLISEEAKQVRSEEEVLIGYRERQRLSVERGVLVDDLTR
jgi:hypothetical protein